MYICSLHTHQGFNNINIIELYQKYKCDWLESVPSLACALRHTHLTDGGGATWQPSLTQIQTGKSMWGGSHDWCSYQIFFTVKLFKELGRWIYSNFENITPWNIVHFSTHPVISQVLCNLTLIDTGSMKSSTMSTCSVQNSLKSVYKR